MGVRQMEEQSYRFAAVARRRTGPERLLEVVGVFSGGVAPGWGGRATGTGVGQIQEPPSPISDFTCCGP